MSLLQRALPPQTLLHLHYIYKCYNNTNVIYLHYVSLLVIRVSRHTRSNASGAGNDVAQCAFVVHCGILESCEVVNDDYRIAEMVRKTVFVVVC